MMLRPVGVALVGCLVGACTQAPAPGALRKSDDRPAIQNVASPPAQSLGRSTLENRVVYAQPDEGELTVPLSLDFSLPGEFSVQEASMVAGRAELRVTYSKARNTVHFHLEGHGLPYRPTFTKTFDDSTPLNSQLTTVRDARWQLWLMGTFFGRQHEDLYYRDGVPRTFLGTRYDVTPLGPQPAPVPGSYMTVQGNARQMVGSPLFDPAPGGDVRFDFSLPYNKLADAYGTPGTVNVILPADGCAPDALSNYWTETVLPAEKFMTWDTFLASIWNGEGIGFMVTAEPASKPPAMRLRSSTFTGWANVYPAVLPKGYGMDFCTFGTLIPVHDRSYQLPLWPSTSRRALCKT